MKGGAIRRCRRMFKRDVPLYRPSGKTAKAVASGALMVARIEALVAGLGRRRFVAAVLKAGVEAVLVHTKTRISGKI